jgi:hypothetical protein
MMCESTSEPVSALCGCSPYAGCTSESLRTLSILATTHSEKDVNYREAWVYFLSSMLLGTREQWLGRFIELAEQQSSLPGLWRTRLQNARKAAGQYDWRRRYAGEKVFKLEPVPIADLDAFASLLKGLLVFPR